MIKEGTRVVYKGKEYTVFFVHRRNVTLKDDDGNTVHTTTYSVKRVF